ncbi:MAG TPA: hypothetical protein VF629_07195 [Hymenobacter sp.]|jgi:hypothetical protein|uniref:hypothetical protein n=1 Tax=Hymenobacter sp. TaxID=1898978 RepID=UPI002EDA850C
MITLGNITLNGVAIAAGPLTFFPDPGLVQTLELEFFSDQPLSQASVIVATTVQSDLVLACASESCRPWEDDLANTNDFVNALAFDTPIFQGDQDIALRFFVRSLQFNSRGVAAAVYVYFTDAQGEPISAKRALGGLLLA